MLPVRQDGDLERVDLRAFVDQCVDARAANKRLTLPEEGCTQGRLMAVRKVMEGGESGYEFSQTIESE